MRPIASQFKQSQAFASMPTAGVIANSDPDSGVGYYVYLYGDYQPNGHAGWDGACPVGTPVYAIHAGTVVWCDWDVNLPGGPNDWYSRWFFYQHFGGRILLIKTFYGHIHAYAHLSAFKVRYGQVVKEGQLVALSGDSSGGQDGALAPHLHVEKIVDFNYTTGGGLIYGRTDPAVDFTTFKPLSSITTQSAIVKDDDMPTVKRIPAIVRKPGATLLGKNKTWYLKDKKGAANLNIAQFGPGVYDGAVFVQGTGLAPDEVITVNFIVVTNGKRSGYWSQDAAKGTKTGVFRGSAILSALTVAKGQVVEVAVTSSQGSPYLNTKGVDLTTYGADLKLWQ